MVKTSTFINHELTIKCGVPQVQRYIFGSIFIIQLNDKKRILNLKIQIIFYDDNTALVYLHNTWNQVFQNIETDLYKNY